MKVQNNKQQQLNNNYLNKVYARIARNNNIPIDQVSSYLKDEL